jgi:thymidine phosphorylase
LGKYKKEIKYRLDWMIKNIDMYRLNYVCRTLWAPLDMKAGIYLEKKVWVKFKKDEVLCTLYSSDEQKIALALDMIKKEDFYKFK